MTQESLIREPRAVLATADAEILSTPDHLVAPTAHALGWRGVPLAPMTLLGRRVAVVAELLPEVHARRSKSGSVPVRDRTAVAMWDWPEMRHAAPDPAVRINGVLAPARHWRTGLAGAVGFAGFCPTAVLLPPEVARDTDCLNRAEHHGTAVVANAEATPMGTPADEPVGGLGVDVVRQGRSTPAPRPAGMSRWVHELVYDQLLNS